MMSIYQCPCIQKYVYCMYSNCQINYSEWLCVDPLSSYPTLEQLSRLECDQWHQLGALLGLDNDTMDSINKSQNPSAEILQTAKIKNIDIQWKNIVEALKSIGKYKLAKSVYFKQDEYTTLEVELYTHQLLRECGISQDQCITFVSLRLIMKAKPFNLC